MRKINLYSIYDEVSELFGVSFMMYNNNKEAIRGLEIAIEKTPEVRIRDLSLYFIGVYDRVDGTINANEKPILVINGIDMQRNMKDKEAKNA